MPDFDVVVVGGGVAGITAAIRSAELGKSVAIVEKDVIGGECLNRACIPSKTLVDAAKLYFKALKSPYVKGSLTLDYAKVQEQKDRVVSAIREGVTKALERNNVKVIKGTASVKREGEVEVDGKTVTYSYLVIATGSVPISLPDFPLNGKNVLDPWTAMNLRSLPERIVIVGGGVAGVELATLFRAVGKDVTVIELMPQLLPGFDKDIANETKKRLEERGVRIYLNTKSKIVNAEGKVEFEAQTPSGVERISGDLAVITIGRKASTGGIDLKAINVETDQRGYVRVDETARTTNPRVYAAGDVAGMPLSATKAFRQGLVAGDNIGGRNSKMPKYIPTSIFADLEIGTVGATLEQASKEGEAREVIVRMAEVPRAWTLGDTEGFLKLVVDSKGVIKGAHMIGEGATEVINAIALAMEAGLTVNDLYKVQLSHPTVSEVIVEAVQRAVVGPVF
ncbi:MAG: dihydrolipoyl dehydrogenase [Thermoprotei archaeon]